jgi:hypothetical protein
MYSFSEGIQNSSQRQRQAFIGSLITLVNRSFILKRMASIPHRSKRNKRQRNGDDDDDESFSAAFAEVRVPDDILQRRAVDQDQVEAEIADREIYRAAEDRAKRNATGDAGGQDGNPLFVVCHENRRNLNNLSGAGREAYIAKLNEMLQEAEGLSLGDIPMAEDARGEGGNNDSVPRDYENPFSNANVDPDSDSDSDDDHAMDHNADDDDSDSDDDDDVDNNNQQVHADDQANLGNDDEDDDEEEEGIEENENRITLQDMRDGVVGTVTKKSYLNEILTFIKWCRVHQPTWLTTFCKDKMTEIEERVHGLRSQVRTRKIKDFVENLLRNAVNDPLICLDLITPEAYMLYIEQCRNARTKKYLSKSSYGGKRSALFHLFRLHNEIGFPEAFQTRLKVLYKGFFRNLTKGKTGAADDPIENDDNNVGVDERNVCQEGKRPMSVELYRSLCRWFLEWGDLEGVFCYCFLVLTWNLMCRANNTCYIMFADIDWTKFDCMEVYFRHMKGDQLGEQSKHPRHIYPNPNDCLVCPVFALTLYLMCCFNAPLQGAGGRLFPGKTQYKRFSDSLARCLKEHELEVNNLGYHIKDIGTHSIRKGAASLIASLTGGPSAAAICIQAGWTMGKVRDIYLRYLEAGDMFIGRCLALLPLTSSNFAVSPPHFSSEVPNEWRAAKKNLVFPFVALLGGFGRLLEMCLAQLVFHKDVVMDWQANHIARASCRLYADPRLMEAAMGETVIKYPWDDYQLSFTGIPPHVAVLHEIRDASNQQKELIDKLMKHLDVRLDGLVDMGNGGMSVTRLTNLFNESTKDLQQKIDRLAGVSDLDGAGGPTTGINLRRNENRFELHYHHGQYHRVPESWRFPNSGVFNVWRQWLVGDHVLNIPPLKFLKPFDVKFLDSIPLSELELRGRAKTGRNAYKRRPGRKTMGDIKYLMEHIEIKVKDAGAWTEDHTLEKVDAMYQVVASAFGGTGTNQNARATQARWNTFVNQIRKMRQQEREAAEAEPQSVAQVEDRPKPSNNLPKLAPVPSYLHHLEDECDGFPGKESIEQFGTIQDVTGDGNCGYYAAQEGLRRLNIAYELGITSFRQSLYEHAKQHEDTFLGGNDWEIYNKGFKSKTGKTAVQLRHDWWDKEVLSKIWSQNMSFEEGAAQCHYLDSDVHWPIFADKFQVNVVCYNTRNGDLFTSAYILLQDAGLKYERTFGFKSLVEMGLDKESLSSSTVHIVHVGNHFMSVAINK